MSIMVVQLAPAGLLFGADRNITSSIKLKKGADVTVLTGQSERPKVLKWPNQEVIVGYVGQAELADRPADDWLYHEFIGKHLKFASLKKLATDLTASLNLLFPDFPNNAMVLHLGGFEKVGGVWTPRIYFIRNTTGLTPDGGYIVGKQFDCSEEIADPKYYGAKPGSQIRVEVAWPNYFSFRQGYGLGQFNTIDQALRAAMGTLIAAGLHDVPTTLDDLSDHVRFQIHGYGAYFAAFYPPLEQFVGGGADVVTAAWPDP